MIKLTSLILFCLLPLVVHAEWSLQKLADEIRPVRQREAQFTEVKEIFLLDATLTQTGILSFRAPDVLRKEVKQPTALLIAIDGNELTIAAQGQPTRKLFLHQQPLLLAFTESYRALLAGDRESLEHHYITEMNGTRENWNLRLSPRNGALKKLVVGIEFSGSYTDIKSIVTTELNGDRTITDLIPVNGTEK